MFSKLIRLSLALALVWIALVSVAPVRQSEANGPTITCEQFAIVTDRCTIKSDLYGMDWCSLRNLLLSEFPDMLGPCVAGPDMVEIPETAVVGAFTATTELLFAPDSEAGTGYIMEPGQTLWVFGMDSSGMYYKVMMSGLYFWVPVDSIGPNYDDVWNGAPLPTDVVE